MTLSISTSPTYPMRVVTRMTGLAADLIRAWERRYGAVEPLRTEGNTRRYTDGDIERLRLLRDAVAAGHSIGAIAGLPNTDLERLIARFQDDTRPTRNATRSDYVDRYLDAVTVWDISRAEASLAQAVAVQPVTDVVHDVFVPILHEVGERWASGQLSISQEHLVSAHVRGLLSHWIRSASAPPGAPHLVFATPSGHTHELGVMLAAVLASETGLAVTHLGADLPCEEIARASQSLRGDAVVVGVGLELCESEASELLEKLAVVSEVCDVWIGCAPDSPLASVAREKNVTVFTSLRSFEVAANALLG